jgi:hypothetical protein
MGRNKLAVICGYENWNLWKAGFNNRDEMLEAALTRLSTLSPTDDESRRWIALGKEHSAVERLVRDRGDLPVHPSAQESVGESALAEDQERRDMP